MPARRLGVAAALIDGRVVEGDVAIDGTVVSQVGMSPPGRGGLAAPGFVDLQVNGFAGVDFLDADETAYLRAGEAMLRHGVVGYQPTLVSAPPDATRAALATIGRVQSEAERSGRYPAIIGAHVEGPFLSPRRPGVHPPSLLRIPDAGLLDTFLEAGPVSMVTLAPELPGALDLVARLTRAGVVVSVGHSDASCQDAISAFERGARSVTHLFNAMRPIAGRDPGLAGRALVDHRVVMLAIVDRLHVADELIRLAFGAAPGRIALITDALPAADTQLTATSLGGTEIGIVDGIARDSRGILAGSLLTMDAAVRNAIDLGIDPAVAIDAASRVPANLIDRDDLGILAPGGEANLVVLDDAFQITQVLRRGTPVL
jgi:N-acetylglucosamine-6-phosphate deacetylase